jgi:mannose-6-phosphate isomerase-like protein (cupin superfamily)
MDITDHGPKPFVTNIEKATLANANYRSTLWTGKNLQVTVMAIQPGHDIGLEVHDDHDQFLRIEQGTATVYMGPAEDGLVQTSAAEDEAIFVPAGTWHNLVNSGDEVLKIYSIYSPPEHAHGTIHATKEEADADEGDEYAQEITRP